MVDFVVRKAAATAIYEEGERRLRETPMPSGQKYKIGQRVHIAKDLGESMSHFKSDADATVVGVYAHMYGGSDVKSYSLDIDGFGESSWYDENQLTAI